MKKLKCARVTRKSSTICYIKVARQAGTLCSFLFIYVCLTQMSRNNGLYNRANLIGFAALAPVTFLPGTCGKASFTPIQEHSDRAALLCLDLWMNQWMSRELGVVCLTWITLLDFSQTWTTGTGIWLQKGGRRKNNKSEARPVWIYVNFACCSTLSFVSG